ncbi:MAG TPA: FadR/GntR family transcriptional regulator [Stellaceae bacterium]|nr:FadR/GntR family transcriptional regulator [Stellaceae bacterium]
MSSNSESSAILTPLGPPKNRTAEVVDRLAAQIGGGRLSPGARLPTEQEMMAALGVSRTVVREAVAALRAQGLVTTRQGLGAFVASDSQRRPFRIDPDGLQSLEAVVDLMELRMAVEIETAGLAAERATAKQLRAIGQALAAMDRAIARNESAIDEDYAFHRAIAEATGNAQFARFLEYLGRFIIPRQTVRMEPVRASGARAYLDAFQREHRLIHDAIRKHDSAAARAAMRQHLMKSRERYRKLAAAAQ